MRSLRLGSLLAAFNLGTVAVAIVCVGVAGVTLLKRLADDHAIAQISLAGTSAFQAVERSGGRLLTSARLLAERPTLNRLLDSKDAAEMESFLETFQGTSGISGCAVIGEQCVLAASSLAFPWIDIQGRARPEEGWLILPRGQEPLLLAAWAPLSRFPEARVIVTEVLDDEYARRTAEKFGHEMNILGREEIESRVEGELGALRLRALDGEEVVAARMDREGRFLSVVPLRGRMGSIVGVIETSLPTGEVDSALRNLIRDLILLTLGVGALATLLSLLLARQIALPIESLTRASLRIGGGDFHSPVPRMSGPEVGALAAAMEEMRGRVLKLTTDLRRNRAEADAVLTGIVEGVYAVDRERRIRYMNPQAAAILGIRAEDALGRFCGDVLRPRGRSGVRPCDENCPILHARFGGKASAAERIEGAEKKHRSVVITSARPGPEPEGAESGTAYQFQVIRDETETEANRRLRDSVLANISHEFRTPLSAQLASLELLRDQLPEHESDEVRELVLSIERCTLRLTGLVDNLLESTRIEAGEDSIRSQRVSLDEVIEEATALMAPLLQQRHQTLEVDLPYPLPPIRGDAPRLVQVFVNLLANANKFAPPESVVRIGGEVLPGEVRLWVLDQGPGIPAGTIDSLFQRFTRSTEAEPAPAGMGLGLYIVRSIVGRHGGHVEAESAGSGTRMTVMLPSG
ncbi:MAG: ATP-binding protein [Candidatus Eisenbacteria bacterium]